MSIGKNIKELRELYHLTQSDLGKIAGVTDKAVSTWEAGIKEPRMGSLQKIADYFGLQKSNLIEENGLSQDFTDSLSQSYFSISFEALQIAMAYQMACPKDQAVVQTVLALSAQELSAPEGKQTIPVGLDRKEGQLDQTKLQEQYLQILKDNLEALKKE